LLKLAALTSPRYSGSGPTRDDCRTTHAGLPNQTASCKPSARPNRIYANFVAEKNRRRDVAPPGPCFDRRQLSGYWVAGLNKGPYQRPPFGRSSLSCRGGRLGHNRMQDYRAYFVGRGKHFIGYRGFVCQDDGEAIEKAKELFEGPTIELWCGARLVTRIIGQKPK
jgi:hypothetical protein